MEWNLEWDRIEMGGNGKELNGRRLERDEIEWDGMLWNLRERN